MIDERSGPVVCFGEVMARLAAPLGCRLANVSRFAVHVGGAEANVAAVLAQLGHSVEMVTVLPQSALGDLCEGELRRVGIGAGEIARGDGRLGLYFFEVGAGAGGGRVVYDRENSAFAKNADRIDWQRLASTARWFHLSGINLALGEQAANAALAAAQAMREAGVPISFDVNHRSSLWEGETRQVEGAVVGAGTVLTESQVDAAVSAGAEFLVSPGLSRSIADAAAGRGVPFLPGVATPTELMMGLDMGLSHFKFFPAEASGGVRALKALAAPFAEVRFCPTGGITEQNAPDYLALPQVLCVGGTWLVRPGPVDSGAIHAAAKRASGLGGA